MSLEGFIGHGAIINQFSCLLKNGSLGHAYVFSGPPGIGKRTLATALAKMTLCSGDATEAPCGKCNACKSFEAFSNPRFMRISPKTQKILIEQVRLILEDIAVKPASGKKVYLIEDADRMTPQAQNCLLKTLEEPPPYAVILMTVSNYDSLLLTIRSRVVQFKLGRYSDEEIERILLKNGVSDSRGRACIAFAEGIAGKALNLSRNERFNVSREKVFAYMLDRGKDKSGAFEINQYLSKNKEAFWECLDVIESVYRDAMLILGGKTDGLINSDKRDNILEYARENSILGMVSRVERLNGLRENMKRYMNYQLAVDLITLME